MFDEILKVDPYNWFCDIQSEIYKQQWLLNHDNEAVDLFELGESYDDEENPEKYNLVKAVKYYQLAADLGYAPALDNLGCFYENNEYREIGIETDIEKAKSLYLQAIDQRYLPSYNSIAYIYLQGLDGEINYEQAAYYFKYCAEANCPPSQMMLGLCLENLGKPQEAEVWYLSAISGGLFSAWANLGRLYNNGLNAFPVDYYKALSCFKLAYKYVDDSGESSSKASILKDIADCYYKGHGTVQNKKLAIDMYIEASQYDSWACLELCNIYMLGDGIEQNPDTAIKYLEKSAEMGNDLSMSELGAFYRWGDWNMEYNNEAFIDYEKALYWYKRGAELGDEDCIRALEKYKNGEWE